MADKKSLNYLSSEATQKNNTTGVLTPILEIVPDDGTVISLLQTIKSEDGEGVPIYAKLQDSNGTDLPTGTDIILRVQRPTDDSPVAVSVQKDNIAPYNELTVAEQRDSERRHSVRHELKAGRVNIKDDDVLTVEVDSSAQVDWSNSQLYFDRNYVEERAE